MPDFKAAKIELVKGLYRGLTSDRAQANYETEEALTLAGLDVSLPYAEKALVSLSQENLVDWDNGGYTLTENGILLAEQRLFAAIPASDRIVSLDHNSSAVEDIVGAADQLVKQLQTGNDVGSLSVDDVEVAILEVKDIANTFKGTKVRVEATVEKSKRTLSWLGMSAAEAVVGSMALALLALILRFFGIT